MLRLLALYWEHFPGVDIEQFECVALEFGWLGGDGELLVRIAGEGHPVEGEGGEIPKEGCHAVHG